MRGESRTQGDESLLDSKCHENYAGTMCMECREKSYLSGSRCEQCPDWQIPEVLIWCVVATWLKSSQFVCRLQGSPCGRGGRGSSVGVELDGQWRTTEAKPAQDLDAAAQGTGASAATNVQLGLASTTHLVPRPAVGRARSYRISAKRPTRKLQARILGGAIRGAASAVSEGPARCLELGMPIRHWALKRCALDSLGA